MRETKSISPRVSFLLSCVVSVYWWELAFFVFQISVCFFPIKSRDVWIHSVHLFNIQYKPTLFFQNSQGSLLSLYTYDCISAKILSSCKFFFSVITERNLYDSRLALLTSRETLNLPGII